MQKKEECCHGLTSNLRKIRKVQLSQTEQAQTTTRKAPPGAAPRSILDFTTEDYSVHDINLQAPPSGPQINENYNVSHTQVVDRNSPLLPCSSKNNKKLNLHKVTDSLLNKTIQKEIKISDFSIDTILQKTQKFPGTHTQVFSHERSKSPTDLQPQSPDSQNFNHIRGSPHDQDREFSDTSERSFEIIKHPYYMKKMAANTAITSKEKHQDPESHHLKTNKDQNGKDQTHIYISDPSNTNDKQLGSFRNLKDQMTLDIQSLLYEESFKKLKEKTNSQLTKNIENSNETNSDIITKHANADNLKLNYIAKNDNYDKTEKKAIKRNTDPANLQLNFITNNQKTDVSQKQNNAGITNWQHDNSINRSSNPITIEKTNKLESFNSFNKDINIQNILNDGAHYTNDLINKPWNTEDIISKRKQDFNQTTQDNNKTYFSPCNLDGTIGIFHGKAAAQEAEAIKKTRNGIYNQRGKMTNDHSTSTIKTGINIDLSSRYYTVRNGQYPYTGLFTEFAPSSAAQTKQAGPANTAAGSNDCKMGANATAARAILERIAHEPPKGTSQSIFPRQAAPNVIPPWRPKAKADPYVYRNKNKDSNSAQPTEYFDIDHLQDDIRSRMDIEIDKIHDFNDGVLSVNGFHLVPYTMIQENSPPDIFAGSFAAELSTKQSLYVCKPCDMAGFLKSNFQLHHNSEKHHHNAFIWIRQNYFLPEVHQSLEEDRPNKKQQQMPWHEANQLQKYNNILKKIEIAFFPDKFREEISGLITECFNAEDDIEVEFNTEFKNDRDSHGRRHWIVLAVESIQEKENPRKFLIDKFLQHDFEFVKKTPLQQSEVKYVADLARLLFVWFIDLEFIPTAYISLLACVMTPTPILNYPESNTGLFNRQHLDLFLNMGAVTLEYKIQIATDQNDLTKLLHGTTIGIEQAHQKEESEPIKPHENNIDEIFTDEDVILQGPISEDIRLRNLSKNLVKLEEDFFDTIDDPTWDEQETHSTASSYSIPSLKIDLDNQSIRGDQEIHSTASSYNSIPSLKIDIHSQPISPSNSPRPSTSRSVGNSQEIHSFKYQKNAIYISNLTPGLKKKELVHMFKEFGTIKKVVKGHDLKTSAVIIFSNKVMAKFALETMNGRLQTPVSDGILGQKLKIQYALKQGLVQKGLTNKQKSTLTTEEAPKNDMNKYDNPQSVTNGLHEYNLSGILISSINKVSVPKYSNMDIKVKLFDGRHPNIIIPNTTVFISCGLAPQIQSTDGIFEIENSTTTISVRNSSNVPMDINKGQIITGTHCHMKRYVDDNTINKEVCLSAYHLQCKTYKRLNQYASQQDVQDRNLWIMQEDTE